MKIFCPLCGSESYAVYLKDFPQCKDAMMVRCTQCGHIYTRVTAEFDADALYRDEVYQVIENRDSIFDKILHWEYSKVLKALQKLLVPPLSVLDFGSGKGKFGSLAKQAGWNVRCVETSPERAAYAREVYELEVSSDLYKEGQIFGISFGAITLFHVLEHLPMPAQILGKLTRSNLRDNGILLIEVPNIQSWQSGIAGKGWMHLDVPRHINHFSPRRLRDLMSELGFTTLRSSYFSFHLGVLGMADSLLKIFGYKKNMILELKTGKNKMRFLPVILILPLAIPLEFVASLLGKGGVIRMYLAKT